MAGQLLVRSADVHGGSEKQELQTPSGEKIKFEVNAFRKHCLLNGLDDIGLTLQHEDKIRAFEAAHAGR